MPPSRSVFEITATVLVAIGFEQKETDSNGLAEFLLHQPVYTRLVIQDSAYTLWSDVISLFTPNRVDVDAFMDELIRQMTA